MPSAGSNRGEGVNSARTARGAINEAASAARAAQSATPLTVKLSRTTSASAASSDSSPKYYQEERKHRGQRRAGQRPKATASPRLLSPPHPTHLRIVKRQQHIGRKRRRVRILSVQESQRTQYMSCKVRHDWSAARPATLGELTHRKAVELGQDCLQIHGIGALLDVRRRLHGAGMDREQSVALCATTSASSGPQPKKKSLTSFAVTGPRNGHAFSLRRSVCKMSSHCFKSAPARPPRLEL